MSRALPGPETADLPAGRGDGVHRVARDDFCPAITWRCWRPVSAVTARPVCSTRSTDRAGEDSGWRLVVCLLLLIRFPNPYVIVLGLTTIILCVLEIARTREHPRGLIVPGIALGHQPEVVRSRAILYGVMLVAPAAGLLAYYRWRRRWEIGFGSLALAHVVPDCDHIRRSAASC